LTLARRVTVLCADKAFARDLATALKAAGATVDAQATLSELVSGELQAALVVVYEDGVLAGATSQLVPQLTDDARVIVILPKANIAAAVAMMQISERVAGVLVADPFDPAELTGVASRVLVGDIFGLEKLVPWGTQVHNQLVGDYQEKSRCIAQLSEFAEMMGVRRKYRESIEQCVDEMLMNALYDAPVDEEGKSIFADIPTKTRISLRVEQKAVVQYACDGHRFAVSVRDPFGTLERGTVLAYLDKCLHAEQQIDRKTGGAGLGLYLIASSSTALYMNVLPGVATEATCVFDIGVPKLALQRFGFFTEKIDAAGRLAAGPSRRLPVGTSHPVERRAPPLQRAQPRALVALLATAIVAIGVGIGVMAWPRLVGDRKTTVYFATNPKGATIEIEGETAGSTGEGSLAVSDLEIGRAYPVVARLDGYEPKQTVVQPRAGDDRVTLDLVALAATVALDSQPQGANVELDGKPSGTTPIVVATLAPNTTVGFVLTKPGYRTASGHIDVPGPGKGLRLVQPLTVSEDLARVRLESDPPGARVTQNGQPLAGVTTPAEVLVEAGKPQRFALTLPHRVPGLIEPFTPARGADGILKTAKLPPGTEVRFEANLDGKISIVAASWCVDVALPASCTLAPGTYVVEVTGAVAAHVRRSFSVAADPVVQRFEFGFVQAAPGKLLRVSGAGALSRAAFEVGTETVTIKDDDGTHTASVRVLPGATVTVE
jgi:hypothetical protein